ncbi:hypothetical protein RFI_28836 [Reticulomyxa filosa]|uniref:Tudor domain-containing protein n=1 Tax=Reticulomyxa filosa TaxID=46433 RepID=X6M695_RETFI|nr:hypothetical protein RFI_28836 [Reticulomyxa filosa]|eukprot:ETO08550.1 hypothetical protein RFI_28836 [Reticulomyxa filosa]
MTENLEELQTKLQRSKEQLKRVKHLLSSSPYSENLLTVTKKTYTFYMTNVQCKQHLKKDLEEVITLTEKVVHTKTAKTYDPIKDKQLQQLQQQQQQQQQQLQQQQLQGTATSIDVKPSMSVDIVGPPLGSADMTAMHPHNGHQDDIAGGDIDMKNAGIDDGTITAASATAALTHPTLLSTNKTNETKVIPREWDVKFVHLFCAFAIFRTNFFFFFFFIHNNNDEKVKYEPDRRWYMAVVLEAISDAVKEELLLSNAANNKSVNTNKLSKYQWYRVRILDYSREYNTCTKFMRTYVPPLVTQVFVGTRVKAMWEEDGTFHRATVIAIESDGRYVVEFDKYDTRATVALYDIQLCNNNTVIANNKAGHPNANDNNNDNNPNPKHGTIRIEKDKKGFLTLETKVNIPQTLWKKNGDDETVMERKKRQKKIKSIKRKHDQLRDEIERKNKQHSWQRFITKGIKKSQKRLHGSLIRPTESIFQSPLDNEAKVGIGRSGPKMTIFEERTHFHHLKKDPKEYPSFANSTNGTTATASASTTTANVTAATGASVPTSISIPTPTSAHLHPTPQLLQFNPSLPISNFNVGLTQPWQSIPPPMPSVINTSHIPDPSNPRLNYLR